MKIVATIFAVLLLLLGGGCTVVFIITFIIRWVPLEFLPWWLFFGLLPLAGGVLILRDQRRRRTGSARTLDGGSGPPEPGADV
jgi:hypothetical protein